MQLWHGIKEVCDEAGTTPHGFCCDLRRRNTKRIHSQQANGIGEREMYLWPIEKRIPRLWRSHAASSTPLISGAAVMMRTPRESPPSISQSSLAARFSVPYVSSNETKPFEGDWISTGACAPRFAACRNGPSACHPRSVAPLGLVRGRRRESKVGYKDFS